MDAAAPGNHHRLIPATEEAAVDFTIPDELLALKERTERFVRDVIMPLEGDKRQGTHGPSDEFRL